MAFAHVISLQDEISLSVSGANLAARKVVKMHSKRTISERLDTVRVS